MIKVAEMLVMKCNPESFWYLRIKASVCLQQQGGHCVSSVLLSKGWGIRLGEGLKGQAEQGAGPGS